MCTQPSARPWMAPDTSLTMTVAVGTNSHWHFQIPSVPRDTAGLGPVLTDPIWFTAVSYSKKLEPRMLARTPTTEGHVPTRELGGTQ